MDKYIIVTTFCNKESIANQIIKTVLENKLAAGSQISKVHSKYWWNNKLEFRTKENLLDEIKDEINKINDYEVAEISFYEIKSLSQEFLNWIDKNIK